MRQQDIFPSSTGLGLESDSAGKAQKHSYEYRPVLSVEGTPHTKEKRKCLKIMSVEGKEKLVTGSRW
jgi:hypothetical protein